MLKRKSKSMKIKNGQILVVKKEVGKYDDFLIINKTSEFLQEKLSENQKIIPKKKTLSKKNEEKEKGHNDPFFNNWITLQLPKGGDPKQSKSRFSELFKKIEEEEKKANKKEENENFTAYFEKKQLSKSVNDSNWLSNSLSTNFDSITFDDSFNIPEIKIIMKNEVKPKYESMELDINKVISLEDTRSTLMIKNIPNKFNRDLLISIIDQNFKGTYDLFILPTDMNKYKNFGYSFINFTSSYYIPYFYFLFNGKMWSSTNSKKICELTYAKVQGKKNLLSHYPSKIIYANEDAYNVTNDQKYIIPNVYKLTFNKYFPKQEIEEHKFYFLTKLPFIN